MKKLCDLFKLSMKPQDDEEGWPLSFYLLFYYYYSDLLVSTQ